MHLAALRLNKDDCRPELFSYFLPSLQGAGNLSSLKSYTYLWYHVDAKMSIQIL